MRLLFRLFSTLSLLQVEAKNAAECFVREQLPIVGLINPSKPVQSDADILISPDSFYRKGMHINRIDYCQQGPDSLSTVQPVLEAADGTELKLNILGKPEVNQGGSIFFRNDCEIFKPSSEGDVIRRLWITERSWAMRIYTERGSMKSMGLVSGATQMFSFYINMFVGFYSQSDLEGNVTFLGVLKDVCTEQEWDEIYAERQAQAQARKNAETQQQGDENETQPEGEEESQTETSEGDDQSTQDSQEQPDQNETIDSNQNSTTIPQEGTPTGETGTNDSGENDSAGNDSGVNESDDDIDGNNPVDIPDKNDTDDTETDDTGDSQDGVVEPPESETGGQDGQDEQPEVKFEEQTINIDNPSSTNDQTQDGQADQADESGQDGQAGQNEQNEGDEQGGKVTRVEVDSQVESFNPVVLAGASISIVCAVVISCTILWCCSKCCCKKSVEFKGDPGEPDRRRDHKKRGKKDVAQNFDEEQKASDNSPNHRRGANRQQNVAQNDLNRRNENEVDRRELSTELIVGSASKSQVSQQNQQNGNNLVKSAVARAIERRLLREQSNVVQEGAAGAGAAGAGAARLIEEQKSDRSGQVSESGEAVSNMAVDNQEIQQPSRLIGRSAKALEREERRKQREAAAAKREAAAARRARRRQNAFDDEPREDSRRDMSRRDNQRMQQRSRQQNSRREGRQDVDVAAEERKEGPQIIQNPQNPRSSHEDEEGIQRVELTEVEIEIEDEEAPAPLNAQPERPDPHDLLRARQSIQRRQERLSLQQPSNELGMGHRASVASIGIQPQD